MTETGHFKGRVVGIDGTKITIDVKAETRKYTDPKTGEIKEVASAWERPEIPKIGAVARVIFRKRDLRE